MILIKVDCVDHGFDSPFPPTRQPPCSPVAVITHPVCSGLLLSIPPNAFLSHFFVDIFLTNSFFWRFCSVVLVSHFSSAWAKTLSSATFVSIITPLACIVFCSPLKCRSHICRLCALHQLSSLLSSLSPPTPAIP